jgi:DNA mismatch repair protein MutL
VGKIRVLDDHLINRIAAGEVVERPASVVKELIENSLDAGAQSIAVRLEAGGKRRIAVADDGHGMDRDDALLALERHATSKLARADDLTSIRTLGFRGEALPSIASVSRFVLRSAARDGEGTEVELRAGRIESVREVAVPRGTTVEVDRLFFSVPARRKFLRADNTELSHVVRLVTRFALAHPGVRFSLEHGGRSLIDCPPAGDDDARMRQLLAGGARRELLPFRLERPGMVVHGRAGRPVDALPRRDAQHLFVNGRIVQDRVLSHAVVAAYGNTVPKGHHAALVLFVDLDPASVDVNVHPQKTEVRFARASEIHDAVESAIRSAFASPSAVPRLGDLRPSTTAPPDYRHKRDPVRRHLLVRDRPDLDGQRTPPRGGAAPWDLPQAPRTPASGGVVPLGRAALARDLLDPPEADAPRRRPRALAQVRSSYIVAEDHAGVVLVDQHAAHERVLFERFLAAAEEGRVETQTLAFPVVVELTPHERPVFEDERDEFRRLGFLAETFGDREVRLDGVPAVFAGVDPESLFRELLGEARAARSSTAASSSLRHRLITTAACKAAIKIRRPMTVPEMQRLLDDLSAVANPTTCPHGRPAQFRLTVEEIERAFRRT